MRKIIKGILHRTWKPYVQWYLKSPRKFRWGKINIIVQPEVFHPGFFFSTAFLLKFIERYNFRNKTIIEVGCGSGLVSIVCASRQATVSACDINPAAVTNTKSNAALNKLSFPVYESNLFASVPAQQFDFLIVNPPYYKKNPVTPADHAWYCGEHLEYFVDLFTEAKKYANENSKMIMVLSDECDITGIQRIAAENGWSNALQQEKQVRWEKNFIYNFTLKENTKAVSSEQQ